MKTLVIDDVRMARQELISQLAQYPDIQVVGEAANGDEAALLIKKLKPEVIFTDIEMPGTPVFTFLEAVDVNVAVVFTTAYADFALQTFAFNTLDYLLKPILADRLDATMEKLRQRLTPQRTLDKLDASSPDSKIMVRTHNGFVLKRLGDLIRIETRDEDTKAYFHDLTADIPQTLTNIEKRLGEPYFYRVSRGNMVNIHHVMGAVESGGTGNYELTMSDGTLVNATRRHFAKIRDLLLL